MTFDVIGFGALNVDKLYQVNKIAREDDESYINGLSQSCGGSAANTLIGLSRLGLNTLMIGKVSDDSDGQLLLKNLKKEGVNTHGVISANKGRSGSVLGFIDSQGQRALYVDSGVNDTIKLEEVKLNLDSDSKVLHLTSFVGDSIKAQEALLNEIPSQLKISFDPGRIYAEKGVKYLENILNRTNILLLNEVELKLLTDNRYRTFEEEIKSLRRFDIDIVVVKRGDKGSFATDGEFSYFIEAFQVKCRDTTGAGDAFNAGFLFGHLKGKNLEDSCVMGNYVAACCVQNIGAIKGLPDLFTLKGKFNM